MSDNVKVRDRYLSLESFPLLPESVRDDIESGYSPLYAVRMQDFCGEVYIIKGETDYIKIDSHLALRHL